MQMTETGQHWCGTRGVGWLMLMLSVPMLLAPGASAQVPRAEETIDVTIINVDVQVTDKRGNRVTGLRAEDFEIREDGKVQPITNFSELRPAATTEAVPEGAASPAAKPTAAPALRPRRTVVLFLEPVTLPAFRSKELFDSIRELMRRVVGKGDQVSIVTFVRRTKVRQEFTDDMATIERTLDQLEKETTGIAGNPIDDNRRLVEEEVEQDREFEELASAAGFPLRTGPSFSAVVGAKRQLFLIRQKVAAMETLIHTISGVEGKKVLIMATRRFGLYAGAEFFSGIVPGQYRQELDTAQYRKSLVHTANAQGVTIYPVHPEGLQWDSPDASITGQFARVDAPLEQDLGRTAIDNQVLLNETAALREVAAETGGVTAWGSGDIAKLLPRVSDDLESYYSLGYRAPATRKDSTRALVVKTKNPEYVVRSRRQVVEKSDATQMKDRVMANLFQRVPGSSAALPFDVVMGKIKKTGRNRWTLPMEIRVPIRGLTLLPRGPGEAGEFSVHFVTGGVLGVMSEVERKTQTFQIESKDLARAKSSYFTYELNLSIDQLVQRLSIGVLDEIGREYGLKRFTLPKR